MSERNLYRGLNDFQGSITDDGRLYDENHRFVGRIIGNDVYDYCNIKQGTIDENGKLWDCNHTFVGEEHGSNFIGPSYQSTGMVRGGSFGEGNGCEYGALMMLKKRNEYYSGNMPDGNYNFPNNDEEEEDEGDIDEGAGDDYWADDSDSRRSQSRHRNSNRNGRDEYRGGGLSDEAGCACFLAVVLFIAALIWYAISLEA